MAWVYGTDEWEEEYKRGAEERSASGPPFGLGTPEWVASYEKLVQGDATYRDAAKTWEGSVVLRILPKPDIGVDDDLYIFMDLWHGECRFMKLVPKDVGEGGDFVITGEYDRWKAVMKRELDVTKGMMQGKLKLKGDLPTIVRAVKAASRLTEISGMIDSLYPDELPPDQLEKFKSDVRGLRAEYGV